MCKSRPVRELDRRRNARLRSGCDNREIPLLVLHRGRHAELRANPEIAVHAGVGQRSTKRNELLAHFLVTKIELQFVLRREPIRRPSFAALPLSPNPAAHQIAIRCVAAQIAAIKIEESARNSPSDRRIRVHALGAKIQF